MSGRCPLGYLFVCVGGGISACARAARKKHFCSRMGVLAHAHMKTGFDNAER